jgi:hypothetical protein
LEVLVDPRVPATVKLAVVAGSWLVLDVVEEVLEVVGVVLVDALEVLEAALVPLEIVLVDGEQAVNSAVSAIRVVCC